MTPVVSVIIPCHNQGRYLRTALDSVRGQSYPYAEIVLINDGSADETSQIAREYNGAVTYLEQERRGLAAARNAGIARAKGKFLNFLDADDYLLPDALKHFMDAVDRGSPDSVFYGGWHQVDGAAQVVARRGPRQFQGDLFHELLTEDPFPCHSLLVPKSIVESVGCFDPALPSSEDWDLWLRIAAKGIPFVPVPGALVAYRRYSGSMSRNREQMYDARVAVQRKAGLYHRRCPSCFAAVHRVDAETGRQELRICREQPEYRPHSGISGINGDSFLEGTLRRMLVRSRIPSEVLTRTLYASVLRGELKGIRRFLGQKVFGTRYGVERYRSAVKELGSWEAFQSEFGLQLPVLIYHNVSPSQVDRCMELTIAPGLFSRQMEWLTRNGYTGIRALDWLAWIREARPLPPKPVLITFDDGYADITHHALPLLLKLGHRCTVFPITGKLGENTPWDGQPLMTEAHIADWARNGMEFGSHSNSHADMAVLDAGEASQELQKSADALERLTGQRPVSFAYPYGKHSPALLPSIRARFGLAFTIREGLNDLRTELLELRRTFVAPQETMMEFACRVRLGSNPLQVLRATLGRRIPFHYNRRS